ncbi:MAG TPA: DUF2309 domain-containing protein [Balneolales bacterium]|nr:DUF2309 domain-containing protein [Balneolales bacterium]
MKKEFIASTIKEISNQLIRNWPLYSFVTSNPLAGLEHLHFDDAIREIRKYIRINGYPSAELFNQALKENQIDKTIIEKQLLDNGVSVSVDDSLAQMFVLEKRRPSKRALSQVDRLLIKWLSVFLDQGIAEWNMPNRDKGFYRAWRMMARFDSNLPNRDMISNLPEDPYGTLEHLLSNYKQDDLNTMFKYHFLSLPGWTGYIKYLMDNANDWQKTYPVTLVDYLAVRLTLCKQFNIPIMPDNFPEEQVMGEEDRIKSAWLKALELSYQSGLIKQVKSHADNIQTGNNNRSDAQFVFCIDTRSERIRRAVEKAGNYETHGYAGFFGIAMEYKHPEKNISHKSYPPILETVFEATEEIKPGRTSEAKKFNFFNNLHNALGEFIFTLKNSVPASFAYVESTGFFYGVGLLVKTLTPTFVYRFTERFTKYVGHPDWFSRITLHHKTEEEESGIRNISTNEKAEIAKTAFELLGWNHFAPLVVFSGHGSQTSNNPFESSLDCGACSGNKGGHNARLLADICNEPDVSKLLADKFGINIPGDTFFLAAEHNTTTNHIHLYDKNVPDEYRQKIKKLKYNLKSAQHLANEEQFNYSQKNIKKTIHEAHRRASDWAETRPEWGLAGNASFIIGRPELTSGLNLGARSFLHSYDWQKDPDGDKLEAILQGPMVVTQWINNHYYFALVDNERFGGGKKVTLNVTGKHGVVQGNGGDLRFGLPLESLREDDYLAQHLPLRLTVLIQAPKSRVEFILSKHDDSLYKLVKNEWIYLAVMDPEEGNEVTFIESKVQNVNSILVDEAY